ncbi:hypothetical protein SAY87_000571 [Trapa incisa]|uniref:BAHD acyltransferase DCR n=1 Tax=Trapa incisa TaxID=236973 RepID=A0AAN7JH33_9MYRT|nr:hypothetical protein SAY87_000571 [Trapa incisa]
MPTCRSSSSSSSLFSSYITVTSKCTVFPSEESSAVASLKLSVSDLPMLACHYIQKGVLLNRPADVSFDSLVTLFRRSLSSALSHFPALAGRLFTDTLGHLHILCNDSGMDFIVSRAPHITVDSIISPLHVPHFVKSFFPYDKAISYSGHSRPLAAIQVTELSDGIFVGCTVNHSVTDGTSFWHFFNTFAEICKSGGGPVKSISHLPDFSRDTVFDSPAVLSFPPGGPVVTFNGDEPLRERIFHFSREAILKLKSKANNAVIGVTCTAEIMGKQSNDCWKDTNSKITPIKTAEISSFQSLCALLWRCVTRARSLPASQTTTFRMAVNCRHRLEPQLDPYYFGNAIQSIPTAATAGELLSNEMSWSAGLLHKNVAAHGDATVRKGITDWESSPRLFPLGNADGASITMGSSPRFPMYDNDFGWGRPLAIRSGGANKFNGKISAFPGRDGGGSVDLEVVLAPATMEELESDAEFMQFVSP